MIVVGKHINDISLNPLEYLLDDDGNFMEFDDEEKAKEFLKCKGFTDEAIEWLTFEESTSN